METTPAFTNAVDRQRAAVLNLSEALDRYRQAGASLEEVGGALDAVEGPADNYMQASEEVGRLIGEALEANSADADAAGRLMAAVTIDAKVAEQAALLAMMLELPDPDGAAVLRELSGEEIADLGEQLAEFARPLLDEIEHGEQDEPGGEAEPGGGGGLPGPGPATPNPGDNQITDPPGQSLTWPLEAEAGSLEVHPWTVGSPWPGPVMPIPGWAGGATGGGLAHFTHGVLPHLQVWFPATFSPDVDAGPVTIEPFVWQILHQGAEDMVATAGAALPFAHLVHGLLAQGFAGPGKPLDTALEALRRGWHALRRLTVRAWQALMGKLGRWAASAGDVGSWLATQAHHIVHDLIIGGVERLLWALLDGQQVVNVGDPLLVGRTDALEVCRPVLRHHHKQRRPVPLLNKALPVLFTCHAPAGAAAAAVLLIFSIWTAHDHMDSPQLPKVRLPGNPGLLGVLR